MQWMNNPYYSILISDIMSEGAARKKYAKSCNLTFYPSILKYFWDIVFIDI